MKLIALIWIGTLTFLSTSLMMSKQGKHIESKRKLSLNELVSNSITWHRRRDFVCHSNVEITTPTIDGQDAKL